VKKYISKYVPVLLFLLVALVACDMPPATAQQSASGASQAKPNEVPKNSKGNTVEQQNINDRLNVTQDTTKIMWIHLISLDGKILRRMPVRNKVTSSSKRLEPTQAIAMSGEYKRGEYPSYNGYYTPELIQPDGTYGSSDPYIYWFDPMGRYHQWGTAGGLGYLLTDYPIDLANPIDEITGLYRVHVEAAKWQATEEAKIKKTEKK
jgi:hypothetical protein